LNLPISYILLKNNFEVHSVFVVMILIEVVNLALILSLAQGMNQLNIIEYLINVILPCTIVTIIATPISFFLFKSTIDATIYIQFLYLIIVVMICGISIFLFGFNKREKALLKNILIFRKKQN